MTAGPFDHERCVTTGASHERGRLRRRAVRKNALPAASRDVSARIGVRDPRGTAAARSGLMAKKKKSTAEDLPSTLKRSSAKARRTYEKTHDRAVEQYGEGERAHRTAFASLKRGFEKKGNRWVPKKAPGPSDPRSAQKSTAAKRAGRGETFGGVDYYGSTKQELYDRAKKLGVAGRSSMTKRELARAIAKKQK